MLLLMRREGETVRINENITIEIKTISDEEVTFQLNGISENQVKLIDTETQG